jgi:hypothetical protein
MCIDELDLTEERMEFDIEVSCKNIHAKAEKIDPGQPGECDLCGEEFSRIVDTEKDNQPVKACGRCRDKHGLI